MKTIIGLLLSTTLLLSNSFEEQMKSEIEKLNNFVQYNYKENDFCIYKADMEHISLCLIKEDKEDNYTKRVYKLKGKGEPTYISKEVECQDNPSSLESFLISLGLKTPDKCFIKKETNTIKTSIELVKTKKLMAASFTKNFIGRENYTYLYTISKNSK